MENYIPYFFIAGMALVFVGLFLYAQFAAKKRAENMRLLAPRLGFVYSEKAQNLADYRRLKLFATGHSHRAINSLSGEKNGIQVDICDFHYTTGSGKNAHHYSQTLCLIKDPSLDLPNFFLRRENKFFDLLGKLFGGQDINFATDEKFSSAFVLQGKIEQETSRLFNQRVRDAFIEFAGTSIQVVGQGDALIIHDGTILAPQQILELLKNTFTVYHAFKARDTDM